MSISTVVRLTPAPGVPADVSAPALRALAQAMRDIRTAPGFRRCRAFRALDASNALLLVIDWESAAGEETCLAGSRFREALAGASRFSMTSEVLTTLQLEFDRGFTRDGGRAAVLRLTVPTGPTPPAEVPRETGDFALRALAAPGTLQAVGGRCDRTGVTACRVDFDTEDGLWHFLDSPLRQTWSEQAARQNETETWALNLPRLDYRHPSLGVRPPERPAAEFAGFNIQLQVTADRRVAHVRMHGEVDDQGVAHCERVCDFLSGEVRRLEIDVSSLPTVPSAVLGLLARSARVIKSRGGEFVLIDNEERVRRVTRTKHLETSLR